MSKRLSKQSSVEMLSSLQNDNPDFERHLAFLMEEAWAGSSKRPYMEEGVTPQQYMFYAGYAVFVRDSKYFFGLILTTIIAAGICVGLETAMSADDTPALFAFNVLINIVFVFEMIVKVVAQGRKPWMYVRPLIIASFSSLHLAPHTPCLTSYLTPYFNLTPRPRYFNEAWNCLDFTIVVMALIPYMVEIEDKDILNMFMIIRLLRIQKLFNSVPKLKVIVDSLLTGMHSLFFVVLILILFFYVFAILGIIMFGDNDPVRR